MYESDPAVIQTLDSGLLAGPLRGVANPDHALGEGSSHDDATAQRLGFRGGTVAGTHHLNLFGPVAQNVFGQRWYESGTLSLYFRHATTDLEEVQAFAAAPAGGTDEQTDVWLRKADDTVVAEGTMAVGSPSEPSAIGRLPIDELDPAGRRILADIELGDEIPTTPMVVTADEHASRLALAAEVLPWNRGRSPWGKSVLIPSAVAGLLYQPCARSVRGRAAPCTGIFGAIELRNINGPALVDTPYVVTGQVLAMGLSPKTELFWFETAADDESCRRIVEMRMLIRMMKASSPLWED